MCIKCLAFNEKTLEQSFQGVSTAGEKLTWPSKDSLVAGDCGVQNWCKKTSGTNAVMNLYSKVICQATG